MDLQELPLDLLGHVFSFTRKQFGLRLVSRTFRNAYRHANITTYIRGANYNPKLEEQFYRIYVYATNYAQIPKHSECTFVYYPHNNGVLMKRIINPHNITSLNIGVYHNRCSAFIAKMIGRMPNLKTIQGLRIKKKDNLTLAKSLSTLNGLLDISCNYFSREILESLNNVHFVAFNDANVHECSYIFRTILPVTNITLLQLSRCGITDSDMINISHGLIGSELAALDLTNNHISDDGVNYLFENIELTQLYSVHLSYNRITHLSMQYLMSKLSKSSITSLSLGANNIQDEGAEFIADALADCKKLEELELYECGISDYGISRLCYGAIGGNLTTLTLGGNIEDDVDIPDELMDVVTIY
jgi:hypothetical protein